MEILESIRIFRRVAEKQSFSQVAVEFGVTQPTISKFVAQLEANLGVSLFRRSTRGLSLTNEGQKLYSSGGLLVEQFDELLSSVKNEKFSLKGQLRITASLAFSRLVLTPLFNEFSELHPELKFHFQLSDGYVDMIENNIDLAIRIGELADSNLKAIKVGQSKRSFYASQAYLKKHGIPKNLESLKNHRLLFYTRISDRPIWPLVDGSKKIQFQFEPHLQSDGSDLIRESVLEGVGIALLPSWMMRGYDRMKIEGLQKFIGPASPIYILSANGKETSLKQKLFSDFLRKNFQRASYLNSFS